MEASQAAPASAWDVSAVHAALDEAEKLYDALFHSGHVSNEVHRFKAFLGTLRDVVDQSSDMAPKNLETAAKQALLADQPGAVFPQNPAPVPAAAPAA